MAKLKAAADKPTINGAYISQYILLKARKAQLESQARNLGKLVTVMETELREKVEAETSPKAKLRQVEIGGWQLELEEKPGRVAWAKEFAKHCGATMAQKIQDAVDKVKKITVKPVTRSTIRFAEDAKREAAEQLKPAA